MGDMQLLLPDEPNIEPVLDNIKQQYASQPGVTKKDFVQSLNNWLKRNSWPS
jgi:hypothetical protein